MVVLDLLPASGPSRGSLGDARVHYDVFMMVTGYKTNDAKIMDLQRADSVNVQDLQRGHV